MVRILSSTMELRRTADSMRKTAIEYALLARNFTSLNAALPPMPPAVAGFVRDILYSVKPELNRLAQEIVEDAAEMYTRANRFEADGGDDPDLGSLAPERVGAATMASMATLTVTSGEGTTEFEVDGRLGLSEKVADLAFIGDRPAPGWRETVTLPEAMLSAVIGPGRPYSKSHLALLLAIEPGTPDRRADVLSQLSYGSHVRWTVASSDGDPTRHLDVVDSGDKGYWLVRRVAEGLVRLEPCLREDVVTALERLADDD